MAKIVGLAAIVAAMQKEPFYLMVPKAEAEQLAKEGLAEINPAIPDTSKKGRVATRATEAGVAKVNADAAAANSGSAPAGDAAKPTFVIEDSVPIPAVTGRGRVESVYPFDKLAVGQSFFVAKPAKNLASTVSSANARYAVEKKDEAGNVIMRTNRKGVSVPATTQTRTFIVRSVEGGSRIWRKA